ncbi:GNAT family N-acetyltransferase [Salimicrobium sp. PL1-032A]|uniref:GNAT family N-acetyltransferase n=1 Tax=Salimicrobium sp. PL1-032A TaxID=3095364 RepID=UPI003261910A
MDITMKQLTERDKSFFTSMSTGIEDDYIARIFERLVTSESHTLYGMFRGGQLVSTAGYSLFAEGTCAMLGRLRSDINHRGKGYSTELLHHIITELKHRRRVEWIGPTLKRPTLREGVSSKSSAWPLMTRSSIQSFQEVNSKTRLSLNTIGQKYTPLRKKRRSSERCTLIDYSLMNAIIPSLYRMRFSVNSGQMKHACSFIRMNIVMYY